MSDASPSSADNLTDIEGIYLCRGNGYTGTTTIRLLGDSYAIHWNIAGLVHVGVGVRSDNMLAVTVKIPQTFVVLYKITDGTLRGRFSGFPAGGPVEEEVLIFFRRLKEDWEVGDRLLANWSADPFWYPAKIMDIETTPTDDDSTKCYLVRFDDGDEEWLGCSRMVEDNLTVGDYVYQTCGMFHQTGEHPEPESSDESAALGQRMFRESQIIRRDGDNLTLRNANGCVDETAIENIRTIAPRDGCIVVFPGGNISGATQSRKYQRPTE